jgi:hypothetical protein
LTCKILATLDTIDPLPQDLITELTTEITENIMNYIDTPNINRITSNYALEDRDHAVYSTEPIDLNNKLLRVRLALD